MNTIDLLYTGNESFKDILKNMVNLLAKNKIWYDLYKYYDISGNTIGYKDWLACHNAKRIQEEAIRLGYKGEIINFD